MRGCTFGFVALAAVLSVQCADGGIILQDQSTGSGTIYFAEPYGQTFTAEDKRIAAIGFYLEVGNPPYTDTSLSVLLYEGEGTGGRLLRTQTEILPPELDGWHDFDFHRVKLTPGEVYTAMLDAPNPRWACQGNNHSDIYGHPIEGRIDYVGGNRIDQGRICTYGDLRFRVWPIPEPSSLLVWCLLGMLGLAAGWWGRRMAT